MDTDNLYIKKELANAKYRDQDKTRKTILETINHYKGLKPVTDDFVFNNGSTKKLLALKGTIPIMYKGSTYHIPIAIWLLDTFPYNAPMVYVNPTPDMRIKVSRHVDHNGKVYLPYLHDWKHNTSELMLLIQVLIMTFQDQPPVYAVQSQPQQQSPYPPAFAGQQQGYGTPYPLGGMPSMPMPGIQQAQPYPPQPQSGGINTPATPTFNFRPSLVSAAEEKLRRRLEDIYLSTEIIKTTGRQLQEGKQRLESMISRLTEEKVLLDKNIEAVQKECAALDEKINKSTNEENNSNVEDAIQAPAPLYKQIVNTVGEEAALEDTIYYLGEALRREQMDLDQYLRTVRQLSRRQFMQRAILKKCRQKAGFAG